jgi:L-seryl-tRNA(Ser) seleniumtransferase
MTSRRGFVQETMAATAALSLPLPLMERATTGHPSTAVDYYDKMGVAKIINAAGTYTYLTGSLLPPEVQAAITVASQHAVRLRDLQLAAGAYIAKRVRCESALVSAGAAAALSLGTAACMTRGKPDDAARDVPARASEFPHEVLIQTGHRYEHEHAIEMAGVTLVNVTTLEDYERAFTPRTAMAFFLNTAEVGEISREDWVRVAHAHQVPAFIDAAADIPPIANLWNFTAMGFDLVTFSGGKAIRGPQNAGLLLGRKDLIAMAAANNNPNDRSIGRGMKVAKEQIVGMVAALDYLLDHETDASFETEARERCERIAAAVRGIPTVTTELFTPPIANHVSHLFIRYDQNRVAISPIEVAAALSQGTPSIELNPGTGHASGAAGLHSDEHTIVVGPWMMRPGEDVIVGRRLREVLHGAVTAVHT